MQKILDGKIDLLCVGVSVIAWIPISGAVFLKGLRMGWSAEYSDLPMEVCIAAILGGVITFQLVSLPTRIVLNLILPERRRQRIWETVACIVTFLTLCWTAYALRNLQG